jgi:thiosulfate/3-mercaptopyruvate sulfurtransferase
MQSPLVSADELAGRLRRPHPPALLDIRWDLVSGASRNLYRAGHLPGAAFVDLDAELAGPPGEQGRHPLPATSRFEAAMRRAGVSAERSVVVYDAGPATAAARAWWLLRYFGHREVQVLDGGLAAWVEAGHELQGGEPEIPAGNFRATPGGMEVLDAGGAAALAERGLLLDARAPERFRGEAEPVDPVAGHIPGAVNRPTTHNLQAAGRFRSARELRVEFEALGLDSPAAVGSYCGSGVTAAHQLLALALAGYSGALYLGSWSEWITDPGRPVATGE